MDNRNNSSEGAWVDGRLAAIVPPENWHPDGRRALEQFNNLRDLSKASASPRWIQLSMAAAVLVSIGLVVTLLPWHALWEGAKAGKEIPTEPPNAATPEALPEAAPAPAPAAHPTPELVTKPAPATPPPTPGQPQPLVASFAAEGQQPAQPSPEPEQKSPVRVGPGVIAPRVIPPVAEPNYSDVARAARVQGTVVLDVIVRADGTGKVLSILRSLGYGLDEKAVEAFEKWRFVPGTKDGKSVDVQLEVVMNFRLY